MSFPEFFARIPGITLRDPLAELLGAAEGGLIDYCFADAVKLAGHSCPTVAGAWLMTVRALQALYGDEIPERGNIVVALHEDLDSGVAGVMASIATLLTGATGDGGFKGLGGRYSRRNLLHFGVAGLPAWLLPGSTTMLRSTANYASIWCRPTHAWVACCQPWCAARRMRQSENCSPNSGRTG
jgi:hypothetical protein